MTHRNTSQPENPEDPYRREPFDYRPWRNFYELLGGGLAFLVMAGIGLLIFSANLPEYWQNIYVTVLSIVFTAGFLDARAEGRARRERKEEQERAEQSAIRQRKEELILQMGSPDNGFAIEAARLLKLRGWLTDGSMRGAVLWSANLRSVGLRKADLRGAILWNADLQGADLLVADLQSATLARAHLQTAFMVAANLNGANMKGANLEGCVLQDADLEKAKFSTSTILPDDTLWETETDMTRFTDPNHPQFWRSDNPQSPAYRAREG